MEKLATLKPVFKEDGTVTAGNACPLNDGAAATLIMSADKAAELGLKPRARIITAATCGTSPSTWASPRSARSRRCSSAPA